MREALAEARLAASEGEVPIGAVVVYNGEIIARAHNRRENDSDPSAHAEFSTMLAAARHLGRWRLSGCTVYVTLEPCLMCAGLMVNARVDRCVYGAADPKGGALGTLYSVHADPRLNHAFAVTSGVLGDECAQELKSFFAARRKGAAGTEVSLEAGEADGPNSAGDVLPGDRAHAAAKDRAAAELLLGASSADIVRDAAAFTGRHFRTPALRVLLAVDSFKGSASSEQVEAWLSEGIRHVEPDAQITCVPVADGGEGTVAAVHAVCGGELRRVQVSGPFGSQHEAAYALFSVASAGLANQKGQTDSGSTDKGAGANLTAVIEMASAAGIDYSPCTHEAALAASTYGVGELILDAIEQGARKIYIGLGGSATTDGGTGMLQVLGASLTDAIGWPIASGLLGLRDVAHIDIAPVRRALSGVELFVLSDVTNPLVGARGAVRVFGPQKGLGSGMQDAERAAALSTCDSWMTAYGARLTAARDALDGTDLQVSAPGKRPKSLAGVPGAGAAGGLGAALLALGARLQSGIDTVLELAGFDEIASQADLVLTGEGSLDGQTAAGKAPTGVARRAKKVNPRVPVLAVCGGRADDVDATYDQGVDAVLPVLRKPMSLAEAMSVEETSQNLICAGETAARIARLAR